MYQQKTSRIVSGVEVRPGAEWPVSGMLEPFTGKVRCKSVNPDAFDAVVTIGEHYVATLEDCTDIEQARALAKSKSSAALAALVAEKIGELG